MKIDTDTSKTTQPLVPLPSQRTQDNELCQHSNEECLIQDPTIRQQTQHAIH